MNREMMESDASILCGAGSIAASVTIRLPRTPPKVIGTGGGHEIGGVSSLHELGVTVKILKNRSRIMQVAGTFAGHRNIGGIIVSPGIVSAVGIAIIRFPHDDARNSDVGQLVSWVSPHKTGSGTVHNVGGKSLLPL